MIQKRITELESPVFEDVCKEVEQWLGFGKSYYMTYKDDEGDVVGLGSDVELRVCIAQWHVAVRHARQAVAVGRRAAKVVRLEITVHSYYNLFGIPKHSVLSLLAPCHPTASSLSMVILMGPLFLCFLKLV